MSTAHGDPLRPPDPVPPAPRTDAEAHFTSTGGELALWTGVLGGAAAWSLQMVVGYAISRFSHEHRWLTGVHHGVSLVGTLLAVGAAVLAYCEWRRIGGGEARGSEPGIPGRSRFLAALGILTSAFFAVVIIAQWVPTFFLDPGWY